MRKTVAFLLAALVAQPAHPRPVTEEGMGEAWPFTVSEGRVRCYKGTVYVFSLPDGRSFALNGAASLDGYPAIDPIWKENPKIPGTKVPVTPIIAEAKRACL